MATLEKIRSKSVLLFTIIIVALLAFILGDFLTSGRTYFGNGTTVAKVGAQKVDYTEYQNAMSQVSNQSQNQPNFDSDQASQQVINNLLLEKLLEQEYKDLGISVTNSEISNYMLMQPVPGNLRQFYANVAGAVGIPAENINGTIVLDIINNPGKYNVPATLSKQINDAWVAFENDLEHNLKQQKFSALLFGLYGASELDAKSLYDDGAATRHITYVAKPYGTVDDETIDFSDADIKAYWEQNRNQYRIDQEVRDVDFIYVPIAPSAADRLAAQQAVEDAIGALQAQPEVDGVADDMRFQVNRARVPARAFAAQNDALLKGFVDTASVGEVRMLSNINNVYTIAKLIDKSSAIDSIYVSSLARQSAAEIDSLAALVAAGTAWSELIDPQLEQGGLDFDNRMFSLELAQFPENIKERLENTPAGQTFQITDTVSGVPVSYLYRVEKTTKPVTFYDVAEITYAVDPSNQTIEDILTKLNTYIAANSSAEEFVNNAASEGYSTQTAEVTATSPRVGSAAGSRDLVKWVMEAKKGKVSPVYQDNKQSYMMAVAVRDIYNGNYLPYTANRIANRVRSQAVASKKGDKLMAEYAGKANDLQGYAKLMGVDQADGNVTFTSPMLLNVGIFESALHGQIAAAEQGKLVGPVKGNNAVMVFVVDNIDTENRPYNFDEYSQRFNQQMGAGLFGRQMLELLTGKHKVDNYSLNFLQGAFAE